MASKRATCSNWSDACSPTAWSSRRSRSRKLVSGRRSVPPTRFSRSWRRSTNCPGLVRTRIRRRTKAFDRNPDLEFEFFLAVKLGRTVAELRDQMSADEFMRWAVYYARLAQKREMASKTGRG